MSNADAKVVGNLTRDIETRHAGSTLVAEFSVAVNSKRGEVEEVSFFDVVAFGDLATNVSESLHKGDRVVVVGRLKQERWEDKETGQSRSRVKIIADDVAAGLRFAQASLQRTERRGAPVPAYAAASSAGYYEEDAGSYEESAF